MGIKTIPDALKDLNDFKDFFCLLNRHVFVQF